MSLTLPEVLGFIPKLTSFGIRAVGIAKEITTLQQKTAKTVGGVLGVAPGSFLDDALGLGEDIVKAAKD